MFDDPFTGLIMLPLYAILQPDEILLRQMKEKELLPPLPLSATTTEQLNLLRTEGYQFPPDIRQQGLLQLGDMYMDLEGCLKPALYDSTVLPHVGQLIVPSKEVFSALAPVRDGRPIVRRAQTSLDGWFKEEGLIVGFSGYGSGGYPYEDAYEGMTSVFEAFRKASLPVARVVDGGTGFGVPGLSGMLAAQQNIGTIGVAPLRSLRGIAPRTDLLVTGEQFGDEAVTLGSLSDLLIAFGGAKITIEEMETAMARGSSVIVAAIKDYKNAPVVQRARQLKSNIVRTSRASSKLSICHSIEHIEEEVAAHTLTALQASRALRKFFLQQVLSPVP